MAALRPHDFGSALWIAASDMARFRAIGGTVVNGASKVRRNPVAGAFQQTRP
jgi:hypothetical protein